jgi:hypothetical protein
MIREFDKDGDKKLSRTEFINEYEHIWNLFFLIFFSD